MRKARWFPGLVDIHMHEDNLSEGGFIIGKLMLKMGVTTACGGNCGIQHQRLSEFKGYIEKRRKPRQLGNAGRI